MGASVIGRVGWSASQDKEGQRTYNLQTLVETTVNIGPNQVANASGLPVVGTSWSYGGDSDPWAYCTPELSASPIWQGVGKGPCDYWVVNQKFQTFGPNDRKRRRCQDDQVGDPLMEPPKISGSFVRYLKKAKKDRNGDEIVNHVNEPIDGLEVDDHRASVVIEQNVADLELDKLTEAQNTLNDAQLWGLAARKIKLTMPSWQRLIYGSCYVYYTRRLEFEIRFDGWDFADIANVGFKCVRGQWTTVAGAHVWSLADDISDGGLLGIPDEGDLGYYLDKIGNLTPQRIRLSAAGIPLQPTDATVFLDPIEYYDQTNFLQFDIPTSL